MLSVSQCQSAHCHRPGSFLLDPNIHLCIEFMDQGSFDGVYKRLAPRVVPLEVSEPWLIFEIHADILSPDLLRSSLLRPPRPSLPLRNTQNHTSGSVRLQLFLCGFTHHYRTPGRHQTFQYPPLLHRQHQTMRFWRQWRADQQYSQYVRGDEYLHEREFLVFFASFLFFLERECNRGCYCRL